MSEKPHDEPPDPPEEWEDPGKEVWEKDIGPWRDPGKEETKGGPDRENLDDVLRERRNE